MLPLYLAAKENIYEIVTFLGATIIRKEACIFMELLGKLHPSHITLCVHSLGGA